MLERKKLFAGIFAALLALNLYGTKVEAATEAETEEARMWGGFRDKISCTMEGSVANTTTTTKETVIVKEVPVYRYPFLFIWDDWYHWGRWHHHVWHRPPRPPRPHISRPPVHRPPRPHIGKPIPRPPRPGISRPAPKPRPHISKPAPRPGRPAISRPASRPGGNRPVMRPASKPRPQMRSAPPRSRNDEMIFQNGGSRGGGARHHGGGRPGAERGPRRR
ncbi:MAG: hypothetical protein J6B49_02310 [Phascolarctobacterium sp.]|nr:hypothetical protein [Phascolarctobacterium sp.]